MKLFKRLLKFMAFIVVCSALVLVYAYKIEPFLIVIDNYNLGEASADGGSFRLLQVSDIQISPDYPVDRLEVLVEKINSQNPDIVVFTGDLFDVYSEYHPVDQVTGMLAKIQAPNGKYAIWGNRDYGGGAENQYRNIMEEAGFTLLENSGVTIPYNGSELAIAGLDDSLLGRPDIKKTEESLAQTADYKILLLHEPDMIDDFSSGCVDLALAGHSHGGQVRVPFFHVFTTSLAEKYTKGFYQVNGIYLYVNTGIGTSHIPVRLMVPPQIAVFDIEY